MPMRVVAVMLLLSAGIAAEAVSYSFVSKASGRLGGPIRFEFYRDSTTRPKTDIESFTVSMRTADDPVEGDVVHLERPWSDTADPVRSDASWFYHDDSTAEAHSRSRLLRVRFRWTRRLIWRDFRIR